VTGDLVQERLDVRKRGRVDKLAMVEPQTDPEVVCENGYACVGVLVPASTSYCNAFVKLTHKSGEPQHHRCNADGTTEFPAGRTEVDGKRW
jgi:hypothetical protein